jgi:hypothetical protein
LGCLFCGKEIGPFRLIRDREFCSTAHRRNYGERLGKALGEIAAPEPPPAGIAAFIECLHVQEGYHAYTGVSCGFEQYSHPVRQRSGFPVTIPQTMGSSAATMICEPVGGPALETYARVSATDSFSSTLNALNALRLPEAAIARSALRSSVQLAAIAAHAAAGNTAAQWLDQECVEFAPSMRLPELPFERLHTLQPDANLQAQPLAAAKPLDFTLAKLAARPVFLGHTAGPSIPFAMPAAALPGVFAAGPAALARIPLAEAAAFASMAPAPAANLTVSLPGFAIAAARSDDYDSAEEQITTPALCEKFMPAPVADPAETYLRMAFTEPMWRAVELPGFAISAVSEELDVAEGLTGTPALCEQFMPVPAEAAETFVRMAFAPGDPRAIAMPAFAIAAVSEELDAAEGLTGTPALCEKFMPAQAAEAAEAFMQMAFTEPMWRPVAMPGFAIAAVSSEDLDAAEGLTGTPALCEKFMPVPAEAAETFVRMAFAPGEPRAIAMPGFAMAAVSEELDAAEGLTGTPALCEKFMPAYAAEAAETYVRMASADALPAAIAVQVPAFAGFAAPGKSIEFAPFAPAAQAEPLEMLLPLAASAEPRGLEIAAIRLPQLAAVAAAVQPVRQPGFMAAAMAAPQASPLEAVFAARTAPAHIAYAPAALALPSAVLGPDAASVKPQVAAHSHAVPAGALTGKHGKPAHLAFGTSETVELPGLARLRPTNDEAVKRYDEPLEPACEVPAPEPVEAVRISASAVHPATRSHSLAHPSLGLAGILEHGAAGFERTTWRAAEPPAAMAQSPAVLEPLTNIPVTAPAQQPLVGVAGLPAPGFVPLEFFCQHAIGAPVRSLDWAQRKISAALPRFAVRPIFGRLEELAPQKQSPKKPAFAEIFTMPEAQSKLPRTGRHQAYKAMAAGLMLVAVLWFGAHAVRIPKELSAGNRVSYSTDGAPSGAAPAESAPAIANASRPSSAAPASGSTGVLAKVRSAIAERASVEVGETFREGMQAWGSKSKAWAEGWTHSPEGWVRPGALAIFQPAQSFKDYRLEFFGQIESKSMDWAVRAKDHQNYHAMKFAVIEPGLRPVLAMVHYPVVNGQHGKPIQTPLNIMVHNNTAYHFAVDVKGNKVTTSIEGQEVDSWTDDTLVAGGVAFFSEAGEKARLYWMKVSKNQDFLGRVCSYLSSGSNGVATAELWNPQVPIPTPRPQAPVREDVTLAAAQPGLRNFSSPQRERISESRRNPWSS